ncbi:heme-binding beta-barrel domain-containing protein [Chryseolinea sp. T2]|uniref:heme-binding beta-barrel domain-containing protein n=1 Tax=Chryseolinea sp. T2 TaxID=3129255 RepID=UPI003077EB86
MKTTTGTYLLLAMLHFPLLSPAQEIKADTIWNPLRPLVGHWRGEGDGADGKGTYEKNYQFVLNGKFIEVRNKTDYQPSKENPKGYHHEDVGYISYDKARKTFVFRQFHGEGFVNQYVLQNTSNDRRTLVFESEAIENIPSGWRARETYSIEQGVLKEEFNLAEPGKDYAPYTTAVLRKVK